MNQQNQIIYEGQLYSWQAPGEKGHDPDPPKVVARVEGAQKAMLVVDITRKDGETASIVIENSAGVIKVWAFEHDSDDGPCWAMDLPTT